MRATTVTLVLINDPKKAHSSLNSVNTGRHEAVALTKPLFFAVSSIHLFLIIHSSNLWEKNPKQT